MNDEKAEQIWNELVEFFGDRLANPDHEPRRFEWQMRFYKYISDRSKANTDSQKE